MNTRILVSIVAGLSILTLPSLRAQDAPGLTVLSSNGIKAVMEQLAPQFERESKAKVTVTYGLAANLRRQIEGGQPFDVAVLTPGAIDELIKQGKVAANSRTIVARSNLAVFVKAGAPKPDISTVDGFKRALLNAKGIAYAREGASGVAFQQAVEKLGIGQQVKGMPTETGEAVGEAVVKGTAEFGILPMSEILPVKGAEVLAPFPTEMRNYVEMVAGISAASAHAKAARSLIDFIMAPAANAVVTRTGMERVR